jgi:hypothetical protein
MRRIAHVVVLAALLVLGATAPSVVAKPGPDIRN